MTKVLNANTIEVLKKLTDVNRIQVINYPYTVIGNDVNSLFAFFSTEAMGEEEFNKFAFYNANEFLNLTNLFNDVEISIDDNSVLHLRGVDGNKSQYVTASLGILSDYDKVTKDVLDATESSKKVCSFDFSVKDFTTLKKASDVLSTLGEVNIKCADEKVTLKLYEGEEAQGVSNEFTINVENSSGNDVDIDIDIKLLRSLMVGDYEVSVYYSERIDTHRVVFTSKDVDTLQYLMAING